MLKRLVAIVFIFGCTSIAWIVLGGTIAARTGSAEETLRGRVRSVWGAPHVQAAPVGEYAVPLPYDRTIHPSASDINVDLQNEPRRKGLLWYSTYKVRFRGECEFRNPEQDRRSVRICLPFPAAQAVYDDLQFAINGVPANVLTEKERVCVMTDV